MKKLDPVPVLSLIHTKSPNHHLSLPAIQSARDYSKGGGKSGGNSSANATNDVKKNENRNRLQMNHHHSQSQGSFIKYPETTRNHAVADNHKSSQSNNFSHHNHNYSAHISSDSISHIHRPKSPSCKNIYGKTLTSSRIPISSLSITNYANLLALPDNDPKNPSILLHIPIDNGETRDQLSQFDTIGSSKAAPITGSSTSTNAAKGIKLPSVFMSFRSVKEMNRQEFLRMHHDSNNNQELSSIDMQHLQATQDSTPKQHLSIGSQQNLSINSSPKHRRDRTTTIGNNSMSNNHILDEINIGSPSASFHGTTGLSTGGGIGGEQSRPLTKIELSLLHNKDIQQQMQRNMQADWQSCVEDVKRKVVLQEKVVQNMPKIKKYPIFKMKAGATTTNVAIGQTSNLKRVSQQQQQQQQNEKSSLNKGIHNINALANLAEADETSTEKKVHFESSKAAAAGVWPIYWYSFEQNHWKPDIRESQTLVVEGQKGYLFGGVGKQLYNQVTELDLENFKWEETKVEGNTPTSRFGHSCCVYKRNLVFFGGEFRSAQTNVKFKDCLLEVHFFNLETRMWKQVQCSGGPLQPRKNHAAAILGRNLLVSGGINNKDQALKDLWFLDLGTYTWSEADAASEYEVSSHSCVAVYSSQRCGKINLYKMNELKLTKWGATIQQEGVYFFGGKGMKGDIIGDLRILRTECRPMQWIRPDTKGVAPKPRYGHSMTFSQELNVIIIHGGKNDLEDAVYFSDTFILNVENFTWVCVASHGKIQSPRYNHSAAIYGNLNSQVEYYIMVNYCYGKTESKLLIFGGINLEGFLPPFVSILELDNGIARRMHDKDEREAAMLKSNTFNRTSIVLAAPESNEQKLSSQQQSRSPHQQQEHNIKLENIPFSQKQLKDVSDQPSLMQLSQTPMSTQYQLQKDLVNHLSFQNFKSFLPIPRFSSPRKGTVKKTLTIITKKPPTPPNEEAPTKQEQPL